MGAACRAPGRPALRDQQEHLVARVGPGVRRLGQHRRRRGERGGHRLGHGDEQVRHERHDDRDHAVPAPCPRPLRLRRNPSSSTLLAVHIHLLDPHSRHPAAAVDPRRRPDAERRRTAPALPRTGSDSLLTGPCQCGPSPRADARHCLSRRQEFSRAPFHQGGRRCQPRPAHWPSVSVSASPVSPRPIPPPTVPNPSASASADPGRGGHWSRRAPRRSRARRR